MTPGVIRLPFWDMMARNSQVFYVCLNQEASSAPEHLKGRKNIVNAYNKRETILAENENREPELMPYISAHILRHTGCTRLGENNVNPKVMQYVMGHSDAKITMNIYNHIAEMTHVENEMSKMNLPETVPAVV